MIKISDLEKHQLAPLQQALLLQSKMEKLEHDLKEAQDQINSVINRLSVLRPDYGGIGINSLTDFSARVTSAVQTAARLNILITLNAIENNQLGE